METIIIEFWDPATPDTTDIEVPLDLTADEFAAALVKTYSLPSGDSCQFRTQRPSCVLRGKKTLREMGIRDATYVYLSDESVQTEPDTAEGASESDGVLQYPNYIRSTRIIQSIADDRIDVLPPKPKKEAKSDSLFPTIFPTVAMIIVLVFIRGSLGSGSTFLIYGAAMGVVTLLGTLISRRYQKRKHKKNEAKRKEHYLAYLDAKVTEIVLRLQEEIRLRHRIYRPLEENLAALNKFEKGLFDRAPENSDFLDTRIGIGMVQAAAAIKTPVQEYVDTEDILLELPKEIQSKYQYLDNAPVVLHLRGANAIGIVGTQSQQFSFLKVLTLDLSIRHHATELHLYFLFPEGDYETFSWLRWLPHCHDENNIRRTLIFNAESATANLDFLFKLLSTREDAERNASWPEHYILFVYDKTLVYQHPVSRYFTSSGRLGVTFLFFCEHEENVPRGCDEMITLDRDENMGTFVSSTWVHQPVRFSFPAIDNSTAINAALRMAPIRTLEASAEASLTKNLTLYSLLGIQSVNELDFKKNWKNNQVERSLAVDIGVKLKNEKIVLDIHEKADGPHGLVAGTTGSGKSELLQSYLINLAIHYHPQEVGFMIIDFKGGGMANQFKGLPHLLGVITNMEGYEVERSLRSIKAELIRRQELFAKANVNNINAYIHKRRTADKTLEALPHLLIVVDEFAELKANQPDFMAELISAARIGRSLGIHLILATQKPSGVVDAQIWSNSRLKLCLKVQGKEDSNEMLHTPLAAEIREPGRAYLQVGNNEVFELFQSAYSGAKVFADGNDRRFTLSEVNGWGRRKSVYQSFSASNTEIETELSQLIHSIDQYCATAGIEPAKSICPPPLSTRISLSQIQIDSSQQTGSLLVPIGMLDDPDRQKQEMFYLDVTAGNIFLLGAAQTGKTTLLETLILSIATHFTATLINVYILDFSNSISKGLEESHLIGGICYRDEEEKLKNLLAMLQREYTKRRATFAATGIGSYKAYCLTSQKSLPAILILVDNIVGFKEIYEEAYNEFCSMLHEGPSLGIYYLVTSVQSNVFLSRTMIAFDTRLALHCNDSSEYISLFEHCRITPLDTPGRGLVKQGKRLLEYQVAQPYEDNESQKTSDMLHWIRNASKSSKAIAKPIPMIPNIIELCNLPMSETPETLKSCIPIGLRYSDVDVQWLNLQQYAVLPIVGRDRSGKTNIIRVILEGFRQNREISPAVFYILDGKTRNFANSSWDGIDSQYSTDAEDGLRMLAAIVQELEERQETIAASDQNEEEILSPLPMLVMVIGDHEAIAKLSENKEGNLLIQRLIELHRYKAVMLIDGFKNRALSFSSAESMRIMRDAKTAIITENLENITVFDIPIKVSRKYSDYIKKGDAYLYFDGKILDKVKIALLKETT